MLPHSKLCHGYRKWFRSSFNRSHNFGRWIAFDAHTLRLQLYEYKFVYWLASFAEQAARTSDDIVTHHTRPEVHSHNPVVEVEMVNVQHVACTRPISIVCMLSLGIRAPVCFSKKWKITLQCEWMVRCGVGEQLRCAARLRFVPESSCSTFCSELGDDSSVTGRMCGVLMATLIWQHWNELFCHKYTCIYCLINAFPICCCTTQTKYVHCVHSSLAKCVVQTVLFCHSCFRDCWRSLLHTHVVLVLEVVYIISMLCAIAIDPAHLSNIYDCVGPREVAVILY